MPPLARVAVVLVHPWEPGNVGATARAMHNLGASDLRIVAPAGPAARARLLDGDALRMATHAVAILEAATFHTDVPAAVADCSRSIAFSARTGRTRRPRRSLFEVARDWDGERVAVVFGTEERGLSRQDLEATTEIVTIPAPGLHGVFNLSQSVLLVLWELVRARPGPAPAVPQPVPRATLAERQGLREDWEQALLDLGYGRRGRGTLHDRILRRLLELHERGGGERDDAAMLRGLARAIGVLRASRPPAP